MGRSTCPGGSPGCSRRPSSSGGPRSAEGTGEVLGKRRAPERDAGADRRRVRGPQSGPGDPGRGGAPPRGWVLAERGSASGGAATRPDSLPRPGAPTAPEHLLCGTKLCGARKGARVRRAHSPGIEVDITNAIINRFIFDGTLQVVSLEKADAVLEAKLVDYRRDALR